jgi:hypothetical protein
MVLGEFTKQLAQQAIMSATSKEPAPPAPAAAPDSLGAAILGQIAAMQKALKEDEELAVWFQNGPEKMRIFEVFLPTPRLAVLSGLDHERVFARVISPVECLQLTVRIVKIQHGAKPARVALVTPKA